MPHTSRHHSDRTGVPGFVLTALLVGGGLLWSGRVIVAQSSAEADFRPRRVLPQKPAITDPPLLSGAPAVDALTDNELVLGVFVRDAARAYPINMLTGPSREIINDTLGGLPIAATWCHLCHNTAVYVRRVDDQTLTFAVSGKLWKRNLVMIDAETGSLWSHFLGQAMQGPLKDRRLEMLPSTLTTWGQWRREHPSTSVLNLPRSSRQFVREFYQRPERFVFGFVVDGQAHHVPFSQLQQQPLRNLSLEKHQLLVTFDPQSTAAQLFDRSVETQTLSFTLTGAGHMRDKQTGTVWTVAAGVALEGPLKGKSLTQLVGMPAYLSAWQAFHPHSRDLH